MKCELKTIREVLGHCIEYLERKGISRARRESEDLLCDALNMSRMALYIEHDRPLTEPELEVCRNRLMMRGRGQPLAYIHGEVDFHGCRLAVNPSVLIPRQETELLVDMVASSLKGESPDVLWDLCCGSGCIGVALKRLLPEWNVVLSDVSFEALEVARQNAIKNGAQVILREGDLLHPFKMEKAKVVVCNPPYVPEAEYETLSPEVKSYEPKGALVSGPSGLEMYQRLVQELPPFLKPNAKIWLEIGHGQGAPIGQIFNRPPFRNGRLHLDWAGKERFFSLETE